MIDVTCRVKNYDNPAKVSFLVHSHWTDNKFVEIEINGERYTVVGSDMITAIQAAMANNPWG